MSIFQKVYDKIKSLKTPAWLKELLDKVLHNVIIPVLTKLGEDAIAVLKSLIIKASKMNISNSDKAKWVFNEFKSTFKVSDIKDSYINLGIELLVNMLKDQGII